ncbi:hypothetical protein [uncultured Tenacibaculum sp.]|uniref:hypothetical protein n=1 Tax=uncultured Tenacibaculum sp. TaxID=174713 RepID=UPI00263259D7|nr:hypothetical protein [uncultured Tenacibaculum sp.]
MTKRYIPFLMIVATLISSCSTEDNDVLNTEVEGVNKSLIQSQKISRDANGKYTVDYTLAKNAQANLDKDSNIDVTTLNVFETKNDVVNRNTNNSAELDLKNDKLELQVVENGEERRSITVEDENVILAKGEVSTEFLQSYSVESFGDGQFVLDFTVRDGVQVDFSYDENTNIYEVHLKEGKANGNKFTKLYKKSETLPLKIDFVNYIKIETIQSRSLEVSTISYARSTTKPRIGWE